MNINGCTLFRALPVSLHSRMDIFKFANIYVDVHAIYTLEALTY